METDTVVRAKVWQESRPENGRRTTTTSSCHITVVSEKKTSFS